MSSKEQAASVDKVAVRQQSPPVKAANVKTPEQHIHPAALLRRASLAPRSQTPRDVLQLQRAYGNQAIGRFLATMTQGTTLQLKRETSALQLASRASDAATTTANPSQENKTGLPDKLKSGIESLSGVSLDDVTVHLNSSKPREVQALAYTRGTEIHVQQGQEEHLPHEAWHVVQQKQGRVRPTMQLEGVAINDDQVLEREADTMGAQGARAGSVDEASVDRAAPGGAQVRGKSGSNVADRSTVIQGVFPDSANDTRRGEQGIAKESVQLDHMVSQKNLKDFAATYKLLDGLTSDPKSKWEITKTALSKVRKAAGKLPHGDHVLMSEAHLINIPENIVPGLQGQIQGAKDEFDPQVAKQEGGATHSQRYGQTELSKSQLKLDMAIIKLNNLVASAKEILPKGAAVKDNKIYNSDTDQLIANELDKVATAFTTLAKAVEPTYVSDVWYDYNEHKVKRRGADWITDASKFDIMTEDAPEKGDEEGQIDDWEHTFTFTTETLGKIGPALKTIPVSVEVALEVPYATWKHIYERHYLPTFAGVAEAVNTFWKEAPYGYLTGDAGTTLLEQETQLALERSINFNKSYNNIEEGESGHKELNWSKSADKLFFQTTGDYSITAKEESGVEYYVELKFKSIAPQDPSIAYALKPDELPEKEEEADAD